MIDELIQNLHNNKYVQRNIGNITLEYLKKQEFNDELIIKIYKIQFILRNNVFLKTVSYFLIDMLEKIVINNDIKDIVQYLLTDMIRVGQINGEVEFNNMIKEHISTIIQFSIDNDLEYLFYEILRILDYQAVYYLFMTTKKFFNCFASVYLKDNAFKHNQVDLQISLQQATDAIQLLMFLLQHYTCQQYQIRPLKIGPNWEDVQTYLTSFRVKDSDICSMINLLALFFAYLNRIQQPASEQQNMYMEEENGTDTSLKDNGEQDDQEAFNYSQQSEQSCTIQKQHNSDFRLKFIYSEQNTSDKQLKINTHMVTKLLQSNQRLIKQLKKINKQYDYILDYEMIGYNPKNKKQKYYINIELKPIESPLQDNVVDIDIISYFINQYFYEVLNQLDIENNYQYNESERFIFGSQFYSLAIIYSQLRQYYESIDYEQCEKLSFGIPCQMICRSQDQVQSVIKKVSKEPKNPLINALKRLVSITYDNQNEKEEKLYVHIQKMMMMTPLIGSSFNDVKQKPILKDMSFFYQEQISRYYETQLNKNMAIVFGQDPETFNQVKFLKENVTEKLTPSKIKSDITGLTSIHIKNYQVRKSINKNFYLIGSIAIFIMMNIEYFTMQEVFSSDSFEFVMSCLVKAIKKKSLIHVSDQEQFSDQQIYENLIKFVEQNENKTFSIVFSTDKEKLIKEFLIYKQSKVDILSCYQTRVPLPDLYYYNYTFHNIVGIEDQLNFCSLVITTQNYSNTFIEQYFKNSSQQAIFYFQPILSIIFQSPKSQYDHLLNNISKAFVKRHEILRTECVIYTFGSAMEGINESFYFKQFLMAYISQFGNQLDLSLLLIQNIIRQENFKGINKTILESYTKEEIQVSNIQLKSLEFGNTYTLTEYQYQKLLKYEQRLFKFAMDHLTHFIQNIFIMDMDTIVFNLSLITDYIWQKRFTNMLNRLDYQQNLSYYSQIYNYGENQVPGNINSLFNSTIGESDVMAQSGMSIQNMIDKTEEYYQIVKQNFKQYIDKSIELFNIIQTEIQLNVHDAEFYNKQFKTNLKAISSICSFNQLFIKKTKQCDPRSLIIDPFSVIMLNPLIEIDHHVEPLMDFYQYQLQQINNQYICVISKNLLDNYYVDRFLSSLVRIGAINIFDENQNIQEKYKSYFNTVYIANSMK